MRWGRMVGVAVLTLFALGCAANPQVSGVTAPIPEGTEEQPQGARMEQTAGVRIESITTTLDETGTVITITGDHPLSYTSYDPDTSTLVLEMPGVDVSALDPVIKVGTPHLDRIEVNEETAPSGAHRARLAFLGRLSERTLIEPNGNDLVVLLEGAPIASLPKKPVSAASGTGASTGTADKPKSSMISPGDAETLPVYSSAAPTSSAATQLPPASMLTAVKVRQAGDQPVVTLEGDGALEFNSFELENPNRLVVDVMDVSNGVEAKSIPVGSKGVQQIRVSQFSNEPDRIARVVFDLNGPSDYSFDSKAGNVMVTFTGPRPAVQAKNQPAQADLAPVKAPKPAAAAAPAELAPVKAPKPAPTTPDTTDLRPVSSSLQEVGRDVVLFDNSGAGASAQSAPSRLREAGSMNTLPKSLFESRTIAGGRPQYRGEKISVSFRDADLREVMFFFADVMRMNVILDPDVTGKVDIRLNQVPWDQAFQVILKNQGLEALEEENVVRIAKTTKLRQEASDLRALKQAQEQAVDPVTFTRTLSYAKVQDAMTVIQQVKTDRGKIVADIRTNTLIISDIPDKRDAYDGLLDAIDTQTPQVVIEARIVEAIRSYERDLGINWSLAGRATPALGTQTNLQFPHRVEFVADVNTAPTGFPSAGGIGLMLGNVLDSVTLDITLEAFEADGKVRILSSPRIATQNNQPAQIEQGVQIPVVTTTATEVDVQYVPASLRLIVTPQITAEDTVIMKVKVENNQPSSTISVSDVPGIVTESVDTQILVRTGTTAVIGGVYKVQESENETGIPGLRRIPFFGWLFKNRVSKKDSSELLVFITPKIVKNI